MTQPINDGGPAFPAQFFDERATGMSRPPENKPCPQCRGLWCGPIACKYTGTQHAKVGRVSNPLPRERSDGLSPDEREHKADDDRDRAKDYK